MISLIMIFLLTVEWQVITLSHSKIIVKNLPGFSGDLPFTLETGYVGVGEGEEAQSMYYFVESQGDPQEDPLILHLPGGPGTSGLICIINENGPLIFNHEIPCSENVSLVSNPYSWTKVANMLFVDLPVGTGFSYAKTWSASRSSDSLLALQYYDFLRKWLIEHPKFLRNPLYISGISYVGLLIPIVVSEIYNGNERGHEPHLNIKGYISINPHTDKFLDFNSRVEYAHRMALISDDIYQPVKEYCHGNYMYVDPKNVLCLKSLQRVDECTSRINIEQILDPLCDSTNKETSCSDGGFSCLDIWANEKAVQKALNVQEGTVERFYATNGSLHYRFKKNDTIYYSYNVFSSIKYHKQLVNKNCHALIISGDHDMTFPYVGMEKWISSFNLPLESPWEPWFVHSQISGYQMTYAQSDYSLQFVTVKGGGHPVLQSKPEECLFMVDRWLSSHTQLSDS